MPLAFETRVSSINLMPLLTNKPYLSGEMQFCSHHPTIPPTMADIKPGPDTAEPDLPPSYDETNAAAAPLPQRSKPPPQQPLLRPPLPLEIPALAALRGKRIILASASPRRKQLLAQVRVPFVTIVIAHSLPPLTPPFRGYLFPPY